MLALAKGVNPVKTPPRSSKVAGVERGADDLPYKKNIVTNPQLSNNRIFDFSQPFFGLRDCFKIPD